MKPTATKMPDVPYILNSGVFAELYSWINPEYLQVKVGGGRLYLRRGLVSVELEYGGGETREERCWVIEGAKGFLGLVRGGGLASIEEEGDTLAVTNGKGITERFPTAAVTSWEGEMVGDVFATFDVEPLSQALERVLGFIRSEPETEPYNLVHVLVRGGEFRLTATDNYKIVLGYPLEAKTLEDDSYEGFALGYAVITHLLRPLSRTKGDVSLAVGEGGSPIAFSGKTKRGVSWRMTIPVKPPQKGAWEELFHDMEPTPSHTIENPGSLAEKLEEGVKALGITKSYTGMQRGKSRAIFRWDGGGKLRVELLHEDRRLTIEHSGRGETEELHFYPYNILPILRLYGEEASVGLYVPQEMPLPVRVGKYTAVMPMRKD